MKKALAMLLTLAMALSMMPMAFADVAQAPLGEAPLTADEPAPAETPPVPEAPVVDVAEDIEAAGDIEAPVNAGTLQSQVDAASGETTVSLTEDVTEDITIPAGKTIILDLAGHKLTNGTGDTITNNGTLVIKDSVGNGAVYNKTPGKSALLNKVSATATLESGKLYKDLNANRNDYYVILNQGVMTISGGSVESASSNSSAIENGWYTPSQNITKANATMTITGGSVSNSGVNANGGLYTLKNDDYGIMRIEGGTFTNTVLDAGAVLNWNELTITGGTFVAANCSVATMCAGASAGAPTDTYEKGATTITGGNFTGGLGISTDEAYTKAYTVTVSGGTFSEEVPAAYLSAGYKLTQENGKYVVSEDMAAQVGDVKYATLQAALDAASSGTVKLLKDVKENVIVAGGKTITLDLNGHTLNGGTAAGKPAITNNGTLTIDDASAGKTGRVMREDTGADAYYVVANKGTMTIENGTFFNDSGAPKGNYDNKSGASLFCNIDKAKAVLNINGGTFTQNDFIVIKNGDEGTVNVTGGTFNSMDSTVQNWGTATISGGTLNGQLWTSTWDKTFTSKTTVKEDAVVNGVIRVRVEPNCDVGDNKPSVEIQGGVFSVDWIVEDPTMVSVTGGAFNTADVNRYVAEGYMAVSNADGTYVVGKKEVADKPAVELPGDSPLSQDEQKAVTDAVEGISPAPVADKVDNAALAETLAADSTVPEADTSKGETLKVELGLEITIKDDTTLTGGDKVLSLDIRPVAKVTAVDDKGDAVGGKQPAIVPVPNSALTATEEAPIELIIPLPAGFAASEEEAKALIIKHTADDGTVQYLTPTEVDTVAGGGFKLTVHLTHFSNLTIQNKVAADGVKVSPAKLNATTGSPVQLTAVLEPENATVNVRWTTGDSDIATVNEKGVVLPIKAGTVTVTATVLDEAGKPTAMAAACEVTVTDPAVIIPDVGIELDKTELTLEPGKTGTLKATLTPAGATYKYIFWTSSDGKIAAVSDSGVVTAVAEGKATITAKSWYGNVATCEVTVKKADTPTPPDPVDPWPTEGLEGFVTRCYRVALGRDPDKAGHADWVRWLSDGTVDASACTYGFVFSKEMNNKKLSDEAFVKTLYKLFMDREGEATGVTFWVNYLKAGHSRLEVFNGFTDSVEFARIKASYGIK